MSNKTFNAVKLQYATKENGGYQHMIQNSTLYLTKDGVEMKLNSDEIMEMLKALGFSGDFSKGYHKQRQS